tara:strand:+ start:757 stop:858 length:102 start_codon:yes stop_codon:yes gene_type:complete
MPPEGSDLEAFDYQPNKKLDSTIESPILGKFPG